MVGHSGAIADPAAQAIFANARRLSLPPNTTAFRQGDACENYLLVTSGSVRVFARSESGREILLYRVTSGNSCVLTTSCLLGNDSYPAEGVTETDVEALAIPINQFKQALAESREFRDFVFTSFGERLSKLITLVEQISFDRLDLRLARVLLEKQRSGQPLNLTHQTLATELGTAREVISRQLKEFEHRGLIKLSRGALEILDLAAMEKISRPV
jgi:CRP/FNR family transcriptional regulator